MRCNDLKQLTKFIFVGFSNFGVSFIVFNVLFRLQVASRISSTENFDALFANACAYVAGMINSFLWNRSWTFGAQGEFPSKQAGRFILTNLLCLIASSGAIFVLIDRMELNYLYSWCAVMVAVTILNYILCKTWVFRVGEHSD